MSQTRYKNHRLFDPVDSPRDIGIREFPPVPDIAWTGASNPYAVYEVVGRRRESRSEI